MSVPQRPTCQSPSAIAEGGQVERFFGKFDA